MIKPLILKFETLTLWVSFLEFDVILLFCFKQKSFAMNFENSYIMRKTKMDVKLRTNKENIGKCKTNKKNKQNKKQSKNKNKNKKRVFILPNR